MNGYRKNSINHIEVAWLTKLVIIVCVLGALGIVYAMSMNRLHDHAEVRRGFERQLKELREQNRVLDAHIARLSSRAMLEERIATGFITMKPIEDSRIIRLHLANAKQPATDLRVVSNDIRLP